MTSPVLAQFGGIGPMEMMIVAVIGLLLFGKRLPEVAKSMGQGLREFKSGMSGFQDEVHRTAYSDSSSSSSRRPLPEEERAEVTAPKFEPPTSAPQADDENSNENA
ncbi:Sec-independent protein translocase subunit TatA/TatB [Thalassoroseus pseudoceratinae]|uniref:Sec-independent protein translocase subunit TatA/TatB n=1 Tax=Thalassoroseus pseudoceratinae TaxID=2713176 RepID=UPI0014239F7A|nr:twin-arginine translocase TatA/TatE family subunit [Thalassoroseus pseudoceratinae]